MVSLLSENAPVYYSKSTAKLQKKLDDLDIMDILY